jgi:type IV pilus assembly protein PilB
MKLGEALINAELITVKELQQALERQDILGGRIDTNLVELKFIDDAKLSFFLGKFLNLPVVSSDMVNSIPEDVIDLLSKEKIEKYKLLPFKKEGHKLHVAMLNPKDIKAIDDLRFITGFDIIPYVITEIKLLDAFEKYYGIKKAFRYISMQDSHSIEIKDTDIERHESKLDRRKYKEKISEMSLSDKVKGTLTEFIGHDAEEKAKLIGALLSNTFYTAKLFL